MILPDDKNLAVLSQEVDFILSHFKEPIFPRTISTYATEGKQFTVYSKEEMVTAYRRANFIDCRVNAYPTYQAASECGDKGSRSSIHRNG